MLTVRRYVLCMYACMYVDGGWESLFFFFFFSGEVASKILLFDWLMRDTAVI